MKKSQLNQKYKFIKRIVRKYCLATQKHLRKTIAFIRTRINSWWRIALTIFFAVTFLYYPIGGWLINDTSTPSFQPQNSENNSSGISSLFYLINQETHHKIWTPNLPILFPSYILDNMPNFQLGVISSVSKTAKAYTQLNIKTVDSSAMNNLIQASEFLQYPGTIWLVAPQNHLSPAPSSSTQYKKAARLLKVFNKSISDGKTAIPNDTVSFIILMKSIRHDLSKLIKRTATHIQEYQTSFFDFKSDDVYYYAFGKMYAYTQITKGLGNDFKEILVKYDIYSTWTSLLKTLDETAALEPSVVRNAPLKSSLSPNHLAIINYQTSLAVNYINTIINKLIQIKIK